MRATARHNILISLPSCLVIAWGSSFRSQAVNEKSCCFSHHYVSPKQTERPDEPRLGDGAASKSKVERQRNTQGLALVHLNQISKSQFQIKISKKLEIVQNRTFLLFYTVNGKILCLQHPRRDVWGAATTFRPTPTDDANRQRTYMCKAQGTLEPLIGIRAARL